MKCREHYENAEAKQNMNMKMRKTIDNKKIDYWILKK